MAFAVMLSGAPTEDGAVTYTSEAPSDWTVTGHQWQVSSDGGDTWTNLGGATGASFTPGDNEVGKSLRVLVTYSDGGGGGIPGGDPGDPDYVPPSSTTYESNSEKVANVNDLPQGTVAVAGTAERGETLTATASVTDADGTQGAVPSYKWQAPDGNNGWSDIQGATGTTFTPGQSEVGRAVRAVYSYTDDHGTKEYVASAATAAVAAGNDPPTGGVTVAGDAEQGATLALADAVSDPDGIAQGARGYRWQVEGSAGVWTDIEGATGDAFTLTQAEVGRAVRAVLSYTDGGGALETVASAATVKVENTNDAPTGEALLIGDAEQGATLTVADSFEDADGIADDALAYRWQTQAASGGPWVDIAKATAPIFTLTQAEVGRAVRAVVSYTDGQGTAEAVETTPTAAVADVNDAPEGSPVLLGATATQGSELELDLSGVSDADGLGAFSYAWSREGAQGGWTAIQGANAAAYTPGQADVGARLKVEATYTDGMGHAERLEAATASPVINVNDGPTGAISFDGAAVRGRTIAASVSSLADADGMGEVSLAWERRDGDAWTPIQGAKGAGYTPGAADIGHALRVTASWTDGHGKFEQVSAETGAVAPRAVALPPPESGEREDNSAADEWTSTDLGAMLADGDVFTPPPGLERVELADGVLSYGAGTAEAFVARLYLGLLGREGDVGGLAVQARALEDGASRADVVRGFLAGAEYDAVHGEQSDAAFVEGLYLAFLGRGGGEEERAGWTGAIGAGASRAEVAAGIAGSAEAQAHMREATTGVFVADLDGASARGLYLCALGREADASGLSYWSGLIGSGADEATLGARFAESDEFSARHGDASHEAFVAALYRDGLGRGADAAGLDHWVGFIESGAMGRGEVAVRFSQTQEARDGLDWAL